MRGEGVMSMLEASGVRQGRRLGGRRKPEETTIDAVGVTSVLAERVAIKLISGNEEDYREAGTGHHKLLVWAQDGSCHEGKTSCIGSQTMFIESTWMASIGSDVTISYVPGEEDSVGQAPIQGKVVWHCPQDDEFGNQEGFGVLFQRQWAQPPGLDIMSGPKEGV